MTERAVDPPTIADALNLMDLANNRLCTAEAVVMRLQRDLVVAQKEQNDAEEAFREARKALLVVTDR